MNDKLRKQLFWEKFRPTKLEDTVLPDRIRDLVRDGVHTNMIFYGSYGCGKSTLARILIQDNPHLILTSKLGVDELRKEVSNFCRQYYIGENPNDLKIVFFEEFDRASSQLQEELKSFIEEHSDNVRFIATTNNINKLNDGITSSGRFKLVNFGLSSEEFKQLRMNYKNRIVESLKIENIEIPPNVLKNIIVNKFPNFRAIWNEIQNYHLSGNDSSNMSGGGAESDKQESLFKHIFTKNKPNETWDYLYVNWNENIEDGFSSLGRPFFDWVYSNKEEKENKLADVIITLSEYSDIRLNSAPDPFITLCALIFKLKQIML